MKAVEPFLMFEGAAGEAIEFYTSVFPDCQVNNIDQYGSEMPSMAGKIQLASVSIGNLDVLLSDSPIQHEFSFTPSTSLFVTCESEAEIEAFSERLSTSGKALMPLDDYGFSKKFAWLQDRFGVSWQLNLPGEA